MNVNYYTTKLFTLLQDLEKGNFRCFNNIVYRLWNPNEVVALFDSIIKGYPIGSITVWQTDNCSLASDTMGVHKIDTTNPPYVYNYILDGYNRISALYSALVYIWDLETVYHNKKLWDLFRSRYAISCNIRTFEILFNDLDAKNHDLLNVPISYFLDSKAYIKYKQLLSESDHIQESEEVAYLENWRKISHRLQSTTIPITYVNCKLEEALEIKKRLNH